MTSAGTFSKAWRKMSKSRQRTLRVFRFRGGVRGRAAIRRLIEFRTFVVSPSAVMLCAVTLLCGLLPFVAGDTAVGQNSPALTLNGRAEIGLKYDNLSGPGKDLRQEPDKTNTLNLRGAFRYRGYELPFNVFLTTDEKSFRQPKDRLNFGINGQWFGVWVGDNNPDYSDLIIRGLRVRGVEAFLEQGPIRLDVVHGQTRRAVEGAADTTGRLTSVGTFERNLTAAQLAVKEIERVDFSFTVLSSEDDASSITYGRGPLEGTALGAYFRADIIPRAMEFDTEIALSSWERGVTESESAQGLTPTKYSSKSAVMVGLRGNQFGHRYAAIFQSVETYFKSLGNPSLRPDKRGIKLSDNFGVLANRLLLGFGYEWFRDNLADNLPATRSTNIFTARLSYTHSHLWPTFNLNFRTYGRGSDVDISSPGAADDQTNSFGLGARYNFVAGEVPYRLRLAYSHSKRDDRVNPATDNKRDDISIDLMATMVKTIDLDFGFSRTSTDYTGRDQNTKVNTINVRGNSRHLAGRLTVSAGAKFANSSGNVRTFKSNRPIYDIGCKYQITRRLTASAGYEHVDFKDKADDQNNYSERIFKFNLAYLFEVGI